MNNNKKPFCPDCGGDVEYDPDRGYYFCQWCADNGLGGEVYQPDWEDIEQCPPTKP